MQKKEAKRRFELSDQRTFEKVAREWFQKKESVARRTSLLFPSLPFPDQHDTIQLSVDIVEQWLPNDDPHYPN